MDVGKLLAKLAGNDATKQMRAGRWTNLAWSCRMDLTEAQGKVLLNEPCPDEEGGTIYALEHAINLREPVFLKTTVDLLWNTDAMYLCRVLDVLNKDAQRQLLKTPDNFINMLILIDDALQYRNCAEPYELWCPCDDEVDINSVYRAAWYILNAYSSDYEATITERYSLKKIKSVLKTPERIDRYAQIVHKEYDYSIGYLLAAKELIESLNISEFEPIWFRTSEDIADEGAIMNNCIAGYWHDHGISCCVFACIYKGHRLDIEIAKDKEFFSIKQCLEKGNSATELADELGLLLLQAISEYYFTALMTQDTTIVLCESRHGDCFTSTETGEIIIDAVQQHSAATSYIKGAHPITGEPVVYKIIYSMLVNGCYRYALKNITGTLEEYAVSHNLQKEFNYYTSATQKYGIILCDDSNDYTEVCIRFSGYDGIENTKGSYLYSIDTGAIYKIVEIDETTITILNITNEDEGINALAQYNIAHGIEFDDDFDDYDDDFAPRFDSDYELFD